MKLFCLSWRQINATVASGIGIAASSKRALPIGVMEPNGVALERHPEVYLCPVVFSSIGLQANKLRSAIVGFNIVDPLGSAITLGRIAGNNIAFPNDRSIVSVEAGLLLR